MSIYLILISCILIFALLLNINRVREGKVIYCLVIGLFLTMIMGLRSITLGQNDVELSYTPLFYKLRSMSFDEIIATNSNDLLFHIFTKQISNFFNSVHSWLFIISFIFVGSVTYLIYKESKKPMLSFILFLGLGIYGYNFTILRHSLALSFIVLSYISYIRDKKLQALIYILLGSMFHISSLIFIGIFILDKIRFSWKNIFIIFSLFIFNYVNNEIILDFIFNTFSADRFIRYRNSIQTFNYTMFFIYFIIFLFSLIALDNKKKYLDKKINLLLNLATINLTFLVLSTTFALFFRVAMFYGIFNIILLPNCLAETTSKFKRISILIITSSIFILYFICFGLDNTFISPYYFFWE